MGPSKLLNFPDSLKLTGVGLAMVGCFNPMIAIAAGTEMNKVTIDNYKGHPQIKHHVSNLSAGIFNSMLALG